MQPIGYAADRFPILALGWFDESVHIEHLLDECRRVTGAAGPYFKNLETSAEFEILDCYCATLEWQFRDECSPRLDANGNVLERELAPFQWKLPRFLGCIFRGKPAL